MIRTWKGRTYPYKEHCRHSGVLPPEHRHEANEKVALLVELERVEALQRSQSQSSPVKAPHLQEKLA